MRNTPTKYVLRKHREFFDQLGTQLGHKTMEDWYSIKVSDIYQNGGTGLLTQYYNSSPSTALHSVYPEHNWTFLQFTNRPKILQDKKDAKRNEFFDWMRSGISGDAPKEGKTPQGFWK